MPKVKKYFESPIFSVNHVVYIQYRSFVLEGG